jgi:hypothetical protein
MILEDFLFSVCELGYTIGDIRGDKRAERPLDPLNCLYLISHINHSPPRAVTCDPDTVVSH